MFGELIGVADDMTCVTETPKCRLGDRNPIASVWDERDPLLNRTSGIADPFSHFVEAIETMNRTVPPIGEAGHERQCSGTAPANDNRDAVDRRRDLLGVAQCVVSA